MLTGRQIREARKLLRWMVPHLAREASVPQNLIRTIESSDGPAWLSEQREAAIRHAFERAGVEFIDGAASGTRLKAAP